MRDNCAQLGNLVKFSEGHYVGVETRRAIINQIKRFRKALWVKVLHVYNALTGGIIIGLGNEEVH